MRFWIRVRTAAMAAMAAMIAIGGASDAAAYDSNNPRVIGAGPRPTPPEVIARPMDIELDCTAPDEKVAADLSAIMENPDSWFAQMTELGMHSQRMIAWYGQQFIRAGRWNQLQADEFAAALGERPEMAEIVDWSTEMLEGIIADMGEAIEQSAAGDKIAACRTMQNSFARMADAPNIVQRSWAAIDTIYTEEARRLGVTLPE
jgi:hypothetical protein